MKGESIGTPAPWARISVAAAFGGPSKIKVGRKAALSIDMQELNNDR
ncbi:MAG: hypothetical protein AB7O38_23100 [Pirellulaceae bacterium]